MFCLAVVNGGSWILLLQLDGRKELLGTEIVQSAILWKEEITISTNPKITEKLLTSNIMRSYVPVSCHACDLDQVVKIQVDSQKFVVETSSSFQSVIFSKRYQTDMNKPTLQGFCSNTDALTRTCVRVFSVFGFPGRLLATIWLVVLNARTASSCACPTLAVCLYVSVSPFARVSHAGDCTSPPRLLFPGQVTLHMIMFNPSHNWFQLTCRCTLSKYYATKIPSVEGQVWYGLLSCIYYTCMPCPYIHETQ